MKLRYYFVVSKLVFMIATPIVLLLLPANFFDNGESICLSKVLLNVECYACGLTRSIMHLIHLEFEKAYEYHMLSFIIFPMLCVVWIQWFFKELKAFKRYRATLAIANVNN